MPARNVRTSQGRKQAPKRNAAANRTKATKPVHPSKKRLRSGGSGAAMPKGKRYK